STPHTSKRCWPRRSRIRTSAATYSSSTAPTNVTAPQDTSVMSRKSAARHLMLLIGLCALSLAPTCGKRRPPLPPIERVPQRTEELTGVQRGNQVILMWPAPVRNASQGSVQSIRRVDVYREAESPEAPLALTEEQFATR